MNAPLNPAIAAAIAAAKQAEDQSKVQQGGGGDYVPPAAGPTLARLVSYIELGKEAYEYQGKPKTKDRVRLTFELIGKKHPPKEVEVGGVKTLIPVTITINVNKSFAENGGWRKLFAKLNWKGAGTHVAEFLGDAYLLTIEHKVVKVEGKPDVTYANITNESKEYLIAAPRSSIMNEETGEMEFKPLTPGPALSPIRCFLWDFATKEMWDSLFIDGTYEEKLNADGTVARAARSKNQIQLEVKKALNYVGSPIFNLLAASGDELEIDDAEQPARPSEDAAPPAVAAGAAASELDVDPLAGI